MKYLLGWKPRLCGAGPDNELAFEHALEAFGKWERPDDLVFHEFLQRLDAEGGYAVVASDNPHSVLHLTNKFGAWFEFTVTPVIEFDAGVAVFTEGVSFRKSTHA